MAVSAFCGTPWWTLGTLGHEDVGVGSPCRLRQIVFRLFQVTAPHSVPKAYVSSQGFCAKRRFLAPLLGLGG